MKEALKLWGKSPQKLEVIKKLDLEIAKEKGTEIYYEN